MKRFLVLVPLTVLAFAAAAEAQSQAGGLPEVSARVQALETQTKALETQTKALETQVTTLQTEAKALETRVNTLQSDNAALQTALTKEVETRKAADETLQTALSNETAERTTADTDLGKQLNAGISSAQFEGVGAGSQLTNEFGLILREIVGPGSWVAIATISNLRGDILGGSPASRACELRTGAGAFLGGTAASNHDADGVSLTVNGGLFVESGAAEIGLWCRATDSLGGASWDGAQMVTFKVGGFSED
jgi:Skp family chaperone for outer membrane proteins